AGGRQLRLAGDRLPASGDSGRPRRRRLVIRLLAAAVPALGWREYDGGWRSGGTGGPRLHHRVRSGRTARLMRAAFERRPHTCAERDSCRATPARKLPSLRPRWRYAATGYRDPTRFT